MKDKWQPRPAWDGPGPWLRSCTREGGHGQPRAQRQPTRWCWGELHHGTCPSHCTDRYECPPVPPPAWQGLPCRSRLPGVPVGRSRHLQWCGGAEGTSGAGIERCLWPPFTLGGGALATRGRARCSGFVATSGEVSAMPSGLGIVSRAHGPAHSHRCEKSIREAEQPQECMHVCATCAHACVSEHVHLRQLHVLLLSWGGCPGPSGSSPCEDTCPAASGPVLMASSNLHHS